MSKAKKPAPRSPDWPFDAETLGHPEVRAAIERHYELAGEITITSAQAMALLGPRRTRIADGEHVSLRRVAELLGAPRDAHNIACGLHSGFPPCCIRFFMQTWRIWRLERNIEADQYRRAIAATRVVPQYIPCRVGLRAKRFVELQECDWLAGVRAVIARVAGAPESIWRPSRRGPSKGT